MPKRLREDTNYQPFYPSAQCYFGRSAPTSNKYELFPKFKEDFLVKHGVDFELATYYEKIGLGDSFPSMPTLYDEPQAHVSRTDFSVFNDSKRPINLEVKGTQPYESIGTVQPGRYSRSLVVISRATAGLRLKVSCAAFEALRMVDIPAKQKGCKQIAAAVSLSHLLSCEDLLAIPSPERTPVKSSEEVISDSFLQQEAVSVLKVMYQDESARFPYLPTSPQVILKNSEFYPVPYNPNDYQPLVYGYKTSFCNSSYDTLVYSLRSVGEGDDTNPIVVCGNDKSKVVVFTNLSRLEVRVKDEQGKVINSQIVNLSHKA